MGTYAQLNGFPQGKSHTCLPSFIVEYTEQSAKAIAKLKNAVDKYAFLAFTVNGFCAELASRSSQASKMFRKSVEIVGSLKTGMSALDSVAPSTASPWDCQPLTSSTYSTASVTSTSEATAVSVSTNWWPSGAHDLARKTVDHVTSTVNAKTWEERKGHNNATAENIQRKLDNAFNATGYSFDALVYLPFTDARMHCLKNGSDSFYEYNRGNTNYFIKRYTNNPVKDLKIASKWSTVKGRQTTILNSVFSTATDDLCKRLREIEKDLLGGGDFSSIAAVRCGYKFVWYQLGYRYFPAAGTTSKHVISSSPKNEYSPNCGQIIFFR